MMNKGKVLTNAKWMIICKTIQSLLQLVIGMLTARYLGPSNYGLINYAKSIVAFAIPFVQLGLDATLVKELIENPEQEGKIMGTSLVCGMVSGFCWVVIISGFVCIVNANESTTILVCILYSISVIFQATTLIQYWFHSKLQAKYPAVVHLTTYTVVSFYKIYLLIVNADVLWFALVYSIEFGLNGFALLLIYYKKGAQRLSFSFSLVKRLISRSHHYVWAALMVTFFQNTDHIMLKMMSGNDENGFYTAAITVVGVCQYIYYAIIDSMRPLIVEQKKENKAKYEYNIAKLYSIVFYLALLQSVAFTVFADVIVKIMYGSAYIPAIPVVRILVWYIAFSYMGAIRNIWILAEEKQGYLWKINLVGSIGNIIMNLLLIPKWGACGAALASLLTQFFVNFVFGFMYKPIRDNNRMLMNGIKIKNAVAMIKNWR